jgi:two-component system nitrate/nitrite sensor histidine kinase NarX
MPTELRDHNTALSVPAVGGAPASDLLVEIAASLAAGTDLHDLLASFLSPIMQMAGAQAGAVRVLSPEGDRLQMISEVGLPEPVVQAERAVDPACGMCGSAFTRDTIVCAADLGHCAGRSNDDYFRHTCTHLMAVPLTRRGRVLGIYNLFFEAQPTLNADATALLKSVGELLGLALHNALLERETLRAAVLAERQAMAAEVHDSIAQTLAFVKMRMPLLQEAIATQNETQALKYCGDVRQAVSSAHGNLREVLAHFRAPMDPQGLRHALQASTQTFRELTQMDLVYENLAPELQLSVGREFQVFRIVQEALANIAKHARASRAWLKIAGHRGQVDVVVEDDGTGVVPSSASGEPSHYGLDIMRQRAAALGGTLEVGPRGGGGTRVHLRFPIAIDEVAA